MRANIKNLHLNGVFIDGCECRDIASSQDVGVNEESGSVVEAPRWILLDHVLLISGEPPFLAL